MNEQEKAKQADENRKVSEEALKLASEKQAEDIKNGQIPVVPAVAESIKEKLVGKFGQDGRLGEEKSE